MFEHLASQVDHINQRYPSAEVIILGDFKVGESGVPRVGCTLGQSIFYPMHMQFPVTAYRILMLPIVPQMAVSGNDLQGVTCGVLIIFTFTT